MTDEVPDLVKGNVVDITTPTKDLSNNLTSFIVTAFSISLI